MRFLTYVLTAGVAFWCGVAHTMASRPDQLPPRVVVQPVNHTIQHKESCVEMLRACYARKKSERTKGKL